MLFLVQLIMVKILSFNVRGINENVKRRQLFNLIRNTNADIIHVRKQKIYGVVNGEAKSISLTVKLMLEVFA